MRSYAMWFSTEVHARASRAEVYLSNEMHLLLLLTGRALRFCPI
jgi:hypothetical protein